MLRECYVGSCSDNQVTSEPSSHFRSPVQLLNFDQSLKKIFKKYLSKLRTLKKMKVTVKVKDTKKLMPQLQLFSV